MSRPRWARRARGRDWFEGSRVDAGFYLGAVAGFWIAVTSAVWAAQLNSTRWFDASVIVAALSTWPIGVLAADTAHWNFLFKNGWTNFRFTFWLLGGGGIRRALQTFRPRNGGQAPRDHLPNA